MLPSETILKNLLEQRDCVKTPAQYIAAFLARDSRCVDSDLIGRVTSAETAVKAGNLDVSFKPAFFWAGNDGLAKWMRIGVPLTLGDFVVDHLQDFGSADFAGVQEKSNGQSLLEAVGYPGACRGVLLICLNSGLVLAPAALRQPAVSFCQHLLFRRQLRQHLSCLRHPCRLSPCFEGAPLLS